MKTETKIPNILFIARDDGGCGFYRCEQPAKFLTRAGLANATSVLKHASPQQLMEADLVIVQEMGTIESSNMIKFMEEHGIPFVMEFDDFIHHISPRNLGGYEAWNPSTLFVYRAMELTKRSHGIITATGQLAREFFPYNPNIYVMPNYLDKEIWDVPITHRQDDKIRIGWAGGNAHADDLHMVSKVLERIVREYDGKVVFETLGMTRQELAGVFPMDPSSENPCIKCGHEGELHHFPGESYQSYPQVLGSRGWDLAIAPVINNAFGNAKSDLKIKEYAAMGIPVVASDVQPYRDAVKNGAPIRLADNYQEWYEGLMSLIGDKTARELRSREMKAWSEKNWVQDKVYDISEAFRQILVRSESIVGTRESRLQAKKGV
jgi:glycosyltransferase involved in cell wall biosynthesis